ncbi:MAG: sugar phosphate isomerase/epimerase family protein [Armatimonas sp.]
MKLAFSTLACPQWDFDEILSAAAASGYAGLELRGYLAEMDLTRATPYLPENLSETRQKLADAGVSVCCIGSSGIVGQGNLDHVKGHAALAHELGAPYVRIFGGKPESLTVAVENLRAMADAAQAEGVALVLETHDDFSTGATVGKLLSEAAHPAVFSLWDLHHPLRQGESPEETLAALGAWLRHVHVKDGIAGQGYTLLGEGDVPVAAMLSLLQAHGYDGYVSVEWEKRWHPELPGPEVALPQYAGELKGYLEHTVLK